jgi:hypothetical protein
MRSLKATAAGSVFFLAMAASALAKDDTVDSGNNIGEMLRRIIGDIWNPFFLLIALLAGLGGIWMMGKGLMKMVEAANDRGGKGYSPAIAFVIVGAMLIALPDAAGVGAMSVLGSARGGDTLSSAGLDYNDNGMSGSFLDSITGGLASAVTPENCLDSGAPAVCMAHNIAANAVPMGIMTIFSLVFLGGMVSFAYTLMDMAKNADGRDNSKGHLTRLVMAILLMNAPIAFGFITTTVFGSIDSPIGTDGLVTSSALLKYDGGSALEIVKTYSQLIAHGFTILSFFGVWAYVRGIFMIKGVAESGKQAGSYGMAAVYMIAGMLMANSKASVCVVMTTVGGPSMATGFCGIT